MQRRFTARAPHRHPGHVDHEFAPEMQAALARGIQPLGLGGPVLEVDTSRTVAVPEVADWVRTHLTRAGARPRSGRPPTIRSGAWPPGGGA